jgi:DNA invertase Pin-like site-specific DNA recombinase
MARSLLHLTAVFAELEREIIIEGVVAGVKAARATVVCWATQARVPQR